MVRTTPDFLANLRSPTRPNRFKVIVPFPTFAIVGGETQELSFLAKAAALPASTLGVIDVPFNGRKIKLAGDRNDDEGWTITVISDNNFKVRDAFERWQNGIRSHKSNEGLANLNDYVTDVVVQQLDMADNVVKEYTLESSWCDRIGQMELSYDTENTISEFEVSFQYQNIVTNTTT